MATEKLPPESRGQGRKPLDEDDPTVTLSLRVTASQKAKVEAGGGAKWVRALIDEAPTPRRPRKPK